MTREMLQAALHQGLEALPWARAAWISGSAATGRLDADSDLDLILVVPPASQGPQAVEEGFAAAEAALAAIAPIELRYRVPEPSWHGHAQCFYRLLGSPPTLMVDMAIMREDATDLFLDPQRHGSPLVLFDRGGVVKVPPFDAAAWEGRCRERVESLRVTFPLYQHLSEVGARRGQPAEALATYLAHTMRPLVELLRLKHCPRRHDFGFRYLDRDLPPQLRRQVEELVFVQDLEDLGRKRIRAQALFWETMQELGPS